MREGIYIMQHLTEEQRIQWAVDGYLCIEGALKPKIDSIYDLSECHYAHDACLKTGRKGAILLKTN